MTKQFFKGDLVKITGGKLAGHFGKIKSVSSRALARVDVDKKLKPVNPFTKRKTLPLIPIDYLEISHAELIPHEGRVQ